MNSQDITANGNNRQDAISKLIQFCSDNGLSYNYTEKVFTISLPFQEELPTASSLTPPDKRRQKFNLDDWGPTTYHEGEEPDPEQPLKEGEPPREQI